MFLRRSVVRRLRPLVLVVLAALIGPGSPRLVQAQGPYGVSCEVSASTTDVCGQYNLGSIVSSGSPPGVIKHNRLSSGDGYTCESWASSYSTPAICGPFLYNYANGDYIVEVRGDLSNGETCSRQIPISVNCN